MLQGHRIISVTISETSMSWGPMLRLLGFPVHCAWLQQTTVYSHNIMSGAICCSAFNSSGVKHIDPTAGLSQSVSCIWKQFEMVSLNFSPSELSSLVHDGQSNTEVSRFSSAKPALLGQIISESLAWHFILDPFKCCHLSLLPTFPFYLPIF